MNLRKKTINSHAFSLVEVIISVAILLVVGLGISYFLTGQKKTSLKLSASSNCNELAQSLVSQIQAGEPNLNVRNFVPPIGAIGNDLLPDKIHYSRPIAEKIDNQWHFFPHQLNENIIHHLFRWTRMKDEQGHSFCGTEDEFNMQINGGMNSVNYGGNIESTDLFTDVQLPLNTRAYLKVFFNELQDNTRNGLKKGFWCPDTTPNNKEYLPNSTTHVTARIVVEKVTGNQTDVCMSQAKIQYHPDIAKPRVQFTKIENDKNVDVTTNISCGNDPAFNSQAITNITVGATIRDSCNNTHCTGIPGGYGPTDQFWKYCFYGSPSRFNTTAGNHFLSRTFEVNLDPDLLNSVQVQYYPEFYPGLFRTQQTVISWPTKTTSLNISSQTISSLPAPKLVVRTVNLTGHTIHSSPGTGKISTGLDIIPSQTGCKDNNLQVEILSGCTGRGYPSRVSSVHNIKLIVK